MAVVGYPQTKLQEVPQRLATYTQEVTPSVASHHPLPPPPQVDHESHVS